MEFSFENSDELALVVVALGKNALDRFMYDYAWLGGSEAI
jgi:hypothetical protein